MKKMEPSYQRSMVIVHGLSEQSICSNIKSNLRLPQEIISRDNGRCSIQITSLMPLLNDSRFKDYKSFIRAFPKVEHAKNQLKNFQLFIVMDVDDCTEDEKRKFKDKSMFDGHWLKDYIVPIYNDPNLEETMKKASIPINKKKEYITIFPTSHGDLDITVAEKLYEKLKNCNCTNMDEYIKNCIENARANRCNR